MAALLLISDGDSERGWCRDGDPFRDESGLECLMAENDNHSFRRNHTEAEITGAGTVTLSSTRAVTVRQLSGGYGEQGTKSKDAKEFHAPISPSYIH